MNYGEWQNKMIVKMKINFQDHRFDSYNFYAVSIRFI